VNRSGAGAPMSPDSPRSPRSHLATIALILLVALYGGGFGVLSARAYDAHETGGAFDLGNYAQALWNAARAHGLSLTTTPEFGPTRWAMHVEPTLFVIAPLYRLAGDDPRALLWLQAIAIALGGLPLYGLARRRLGSEWGALGLVLAYFLLPALESVTLFDFHAVGLAPTFVLAALYCLDRALVTPDDRRGLWPSSPPDATAAAHQPVGSRSDWLLGSMFLLLALGTKEDMPLAVGLLGIYLALFRRRLRVGLGLTLLSALWFWLAVFIVTPSARPDGGHSAYLEFFAPLGRTPLEILLSPLHSPARVLAFIATPATLHGLVMLLLPLALTPMIGLSLLWIAAPVLAIPLFSANPMMHKLETYHYAAPALPFVAVAAADGVGHLAAWLRRVTLRASVHMRAAIVVTVVVLTALGYHYFRGYTPLARPFHWPQISEHDRLGHALAATIPADAPVVAQAELVPLLANRPYVRVWTGPFDPLADYYLLDVSHPAFTNRNGAQQRLVADIAYEPSVGVIASQDGYLVLQRGAPRVPITPEFFTFIRQPSSAPPLTGEAGRGPLDATFGETLRLIAWAADRLPTDREAEPLLTTTWQVLRAPGEDYLIAVFLLDDANRPVGVTLHQQPATVWWPTGRWQAGETMRILANTFPWWTGDRTRFGYGLAVVRGDDPWRVSARLPVVRADGGPPPLDDGTLLPVVTFTRVAGIPYAD
jgi:uncharacterized membrane protein